ncbi:MAG: hypothetical protein KGK07_07185 [Chloroflexota bacterium]|nr:hypothetical protein [Chloroflexota bacterium]
MSELYTVTPGAATMAADLNQLTDTLNGALDPGPITFAAPVAAPGAPSVTLAAGSLTGTFAWAAYWITGVLDGAGNHYTNATTAYGTATSGTALSSQEGVLSAPASPPSQAIGWGLCRTKDGGSTYYEIATAYKTTAGTWPQITDNTADASLTVLAPTANTTGTIPTFGSGAALPNAQALTAAESGGTARNVVQMDASDHVLVGDDSDTDPLYLHGSSVNTAKQIVSTLSTGTAPLSVSSTTQVANLNAQGLGGTVEVEVAMLWFGTGVTYRLTPAATGATANVLAKIGTALAGSVYYLEITYADINTSTNQIQLYDVTGAADVSASNITFTAANTGGTVLLRSSAFSLTSGNQYSVNANSATDNNLFVSVRIVTTL